VSSNPAWAAGRPSPVIIGTTLTWIPITATLDRQKSPMISHSGRPANACRTVSHP
jgi:hypothetical protein